MRLAEYNIIKERKCVTVYNNNNNKCAAADNENNDAQIVRKSL